MPVVFKAAAACCPLVHFYNKHTRHPNTNATFQPNPPQKNRPAIVTHFRVTEHQLEQLGRDVQPFLQYFVLRPQARPPPQADGAFLCVCGLSGGFGCFGGVVGLWTGVGTENPNGTMCSAASTL